MGYGLVFLVLFFLWRAGVSLATCDGLIDFDVSFFFFLVVRFWRRGNRVVF
jgi:hypothetical protein